MDEAERAAPAAIADEARQGFLPQPRLLLLTALLGLVVWTDLVRYQDPIGEKHFRLLEPGAADFSVIFDGTRVFLDGHNPYYYRDASSLDRWGRGDIIGGRWFRVSYQPSHFLAYIPIALVTTNNREAGRIVFAISVALYFLIAFMTWRIVMRAAQPTGEERRLALLLLPLLAVLLVGNMGTGLLLARCQSDVINAALCWGAVLLFLRGGRFWPMFLVTSAVAMKGYGCLFGTGLFFLGLRRGGWRAEIGGVLAAAAFWLLPVLPYLHDGFVAAVSHADGFFTPEWLNQSFQNVFFHISPALARPGRLAATILALLASAGCWWLARGAQQRSDARGAVLWLSLFATMSLTTMIGFSSVSFIYNQILMLPGALVLFSVGDRIWSDCGFTARAHGWLLAIESLTGFLLLKYVLPPFSIPLAGLGYMLLAALLATGVAWRLLHADRVPTVQPARSGLPANRAVGPR
jgi:hypothetical protein